MPSVCPSVCAPPAFSPLLFCVFCVLPPDRSESTPFFIFIFIFCECRETDEGGEGLDYTTTSHTYTQRLRPVRRLLCRSPRVRVVPNKRRCYCCFSSSFSLFFCLSVPVPFRSVFISFCASSPFYCLDRQGGRGKRLSDKGKWSSTFRSSEAGTTEGERKGSCTLIRLFFVFYFFLILLSPGLVPSCRFLVL